MTNAPAEMTKIDHGQALVEFLDRHFLVDRGLSPGHQRLIEAMRYSLLQKGSKRFRPMLACLTAEALSCPADRVLPFAAAVECVHTYSLIHDDLPAMDNDDFRRGEPTNHKAFDEATAILAGDALLTEAFELLVENYLNEPLLAVHLVRELSQASGVRGMVGGQAIDLAARGAKFNLDELRNLHRLKTGQLIRVSALGAAWVAGASVSQMTEISDFAENLGLAFQIADDILDYDPKKPEDGSYPSLLGEPEAKQILDHTTEKSLAALSSWGAAAEPLRELARYNRNRTR